MKTWISTIIIITATMFTACSANAEVICPAVPDVTISNFAPYKSSLPSAEQAKIDALAAQISKLKKGGERLKSIRVIGHAAKYGKSDFKATSTNRAQVVASQLRAALEARSVKTSSIRIGVKGMSIDCPVATNASKSGRAKNRRVEIYLGAIENRKNGKRNSGKPTAKVPSLNKLLGSVTVSSKSPATKCIARKLKRKGVDAEFYTVSGLNEALNEPMNKKTFYNFRKYKSNLQGLANSARARYAKVPTKETPKQRFAKFMERQRAELMRTVRSLGSSADCYDKRIVAVRADLIRLSKVKNSFYSCKLIRDEVEAMLDSIGGTPRGCSKF